MASLVIHQGWRRTAPWVVQGGAGRVARLGPRGADWQATGSLTAAADAARDAACPTLHLRRAPSILDGLPPLRCQGTRRGAGRPREGADPKSWRERWEPGARFGRRACRLLSEVGGTARAISLQIYITGRGPCRFRRISRRKTRASSIFPALSASF